MRMMMLFIACFLLACNKPSIKDFPKEEMDTPTSLDANTPFLIILGNVQDAGSPQLGCTKACCINLDVCEAAERQVVSLGLVDPKQDKSWLFEATPDLTDQAKFLSDYSNKVLPSGIFLTHAHIGHYAGLMYLGKEALGAKKMPVYSMPRMQEFLTNNGPWSQLVSDSNVVLRSISSGSIEELSSNSAGPSASTLKVTPLQVPHRDEFSETVGYRIDGPNKSALFIPDIDKWERWETDISEVLETVDYALLDATFYDGDELPGRDMAQIPHPFVVESMNRFASLPDSIRSRVYFIHFNHTNPLLNETSAQSKAVIDAGYKIARRGDVLPL
jgi:pyrroloquinoline quinone biosynthesis protein B